MAGFNLRSVALFSKEKGTYNNDNLQVKEYFKDENLWLNTQTPKNYPTEYFELEDGYKLLLEGMIYNLEFKDEIENLIKLVKAKEDVEIANIVSEWDGEFVITIIDSKSSNCTIINDSWGRLPVYYYNQNEQFIVTRNISNITQNIDLKYDPEVLGISILLGLTLGQDTIWEKVNKLPPHSMLTFNFEEKKISGGSYFDLRTVSGDATLDEVKEEIKDVFTASLKSRLDKMINPTLSLSGGLDSRLIAAAIKDQEKDIPFITYNRDNGVDHLDLDSSKIIIDKLGSEKQHEVVQLGNTELSDTDELLAIKQGFNYLSMSYILPYYRMHTDRNISTITGDGGGKFFVDLYPLKNLSSMKNLIGYILRYNAFCSIETAAEIAKITPAVLKAKLVKCLQEYPFASYNDKYTFFLIREAGINWALEGEDRNRHYTWSTTPYYNPHLIRLCLAIPQRAKEYGQLFKYMYQQFPGELQHVSNPNWDEVVDNSKSVRKIHNRQKIKSFLPTFILDKKKGISIDEFEFNDALKTALSEWKHSDTLNTSSLKDKNSTNFYWQLFTLTKLIDSNS